MMFYLVLLLGSSVVSYIYSRAKDINVLAISKCSVFIIMFIPSALRYGIGTDYSMYADIFKTIERNNDVGIEYGYKTLNQICIFLGFNVQWVFLVMSFLTLIFLFYAVPRKSFYIIVPFYFMLLYTASYNIMRQSLAVTIAYYAYQLFDKKKIIRAFLYVLIASFFHRSALLYCFLFLLMLLFKLDKKGALLYFLVLLFIGIYADNLIALIFEHIVSYTAYSHYLTNVLFNSKTVNEWYGMFLRYAIFFILLVSMPNIENKHSSNAYIAFLFYIFAYLLGQSILIFGRLANGFSFAWFPVLHFINTYYTKYRKMVLLLIYFWGLFYFITSLKNNFGEVIPYRSIFQK